MNLTSMNTHSPAVPSQEDNPLAPRPEKELIRMFGLPPNFFQLQQSLEHFFGDYPFLPELSQVYYVIDYCGNGLEHADKSELSYIVTYAEALMESDYYHRLLQELDGQEPATTDEAASVVKIIISTMTIQNNVIPEMLAEVYMEIINEMNPSKLTLHFARLSIRNQMKFVPSPKEFRDKLIVATKSLDFLQIYAKQILPERLRGAVERLERRGYGKEAN